MGDRFDEECTVVKTTFLSGQQPADAPGTNAGRCLDVP
jgi:hypothetical protein